MTSSSHRFRSPSNPGRFTYIPKPEITHYGGNCNATYKYNQTGILSLDANNNLSEGVGTSFSTPLVSSLYANIRTGIDGGASRNLSKALLVHSAVVKSNGHKAEQLKYLGFGIPGDFDQAVFCAPWQATLVFEATINPYQREFVRPNFPIPDCLRNLDGKVNGEFIMTLVYDPPLDPSAGYEYCQANIDVSLGSNDLDKTGKHAHHKLVPLEPKNISDMYEASLIDHGFKWSPLKVYRVNLKRTQGKDWDLRMSMSYRRPSTEENINFALLVTMIDPNKKLPVYNDVIRAMSRSGWITQDLKIQDRVRARV